jgi:hypothetical protein
VAVEALVVRGEALVVRAVARLVEVERRHHQPRPRHVTPHPRGRLNVLARGLGLARHHHEAQAVDVDADGDHVGREEHIDVLLVRDRLAQPIARAGDAVHALARGELDRLAELSNTKPPRRAPRPPRCGARRCGRSASAPRPRRGAHATELAQRVEVADEGGVRVGRVARRAGAAPCATRP